MESAFGHSPHGECGLKSVIKEYGKVDKLSLPAWGVWIEMHFRMYRDSHCNVTPRMGSVD